jgi:MFS family permease
MRKTVANGARLGKVLRTHLTFRPRFTKFAGPPDHGEVVSTPSKRELLLSLKYATIEACFSVPMLNLTRAQLPFVIGFAATVLGWDPSTIGLMVATPLLCHVIQPPVTHWLQRRFSLREIMLINFVVNALPWAFVSVFPWLGASKNWLLFLIVFISSLADSVAAVAWSAAMSELVPVSIRGRYFGDRNVIFGFWNFVVLLAAGQYVDHFNNSMRAFGAVFATAAGARMLGMYYLACMKFPRAVTERRTTSAKLSEYLEVFRDGNYMRLLLFIGLWGFALNLGTPFYNVYVLKQLPLSVGDLTVLVTISSLGGLLSLRSWGPLSDRYGNKPVMVTCSLLWATTAAVCWLFTGPARHGHLYLNYFITGFMTAGFQLCQFNLMINLVPAHRKAHYISVFFAFTNLLTALGPMLGGHFLNWLPARMGSFLGQPLTNYHVLFVGSLMLCLLTVHILQSMSEPAERPLRELVRVMRNMREFNPVLGLASLAEYTLRRQTQEVADVGEELVGGGWRAIQQPLKALKKDKEEPPKP